MRFNEFVDFAPQANTPKLVVPRGTRGPEVADLQKALIALGYKLPKHGVDGFRGPETNAAIKKFEKDNALTQDGSPDKSMIDLMNKKIKDLKITFPKSTEADVKPGQNVDDEEETVRSGPNPNIDDETRRRAQQQVNMTGIGTNTMGSPSEEIVTYLKMQENAPLATGKQKKSAAFWDHKQYTNGYGTKANSATEVIDEQEADRRLRAVIQDNYDKIVEFVKDKYKWGPNQLDAMTSFVHNGGIGWLYQVTQNGRRNNKEIADNMLKYINAGGKPKVSLIKRRQDEVERFLRFSSET